jgi:hypothetical protein
MGEELRDVMLDIGQTAASHALRMALLLGLQSLAGRKCKNWDLGLGRHVFPQGAPQEFRCRASFGLSDVIQFVEHEKQAPDGGPDALKISELGLGNRRID